MRGDRGGRGIEESWDPCRNQLYYLSCSTITIGCRTQLYPQNQVIDFAFDNHVIRREAVKVKDGHSMTQCFSLWVYNVQFCKGKKNTIDVEKLSWYYFLSLASFFCCTLCNLAVMEIWFWRLAPWQRLYQSDGGNKIPYTNRFGFDQGSASTIHNKKGRDPFEIGATSYGDGRFIFSVKFPKVITM